MKVTVTGKGTGGMKPAEIAIAAAQVISERGHCKKTLFDIAGRRCLVGALMVIRQREHWQPSDGKAVRKVLRACDDILSERGWDPDPIAFNNDPRTSGEDIILLLKEASVRLGSAQD